MITSEITTMKNPSVLAGRVVFGTAGSIAIVRTIAKPSFHKEGRPLAPKNGNIKAIMLTRSKAQKNV